MFFKSSYLKRVASTYWLTCRRSSTSLNSFPSATDKGFTTRGAISHSLMQRLVNNFAIASSTKLECARADWLLLGKAEAGKRLSGRAVRNAIFYKTGQDSFDNQCSSAQKSSFNSGRYPARLILKVSRKRKLNLRRLIWMRLIHRYCCGSFTAGHEVSGCWSWRSQPFAGTWIADAQTCHRRSRDPNSPRAP